MLPEWKTVPPVQVTHQGQIMSSSIGGVRRSHQLVPLTQGGRGVEIEFIDLPGAPLLFIFAWQEAVVRPVLASVRTAVEQDVSLRD